MIGWLYAVFGLFMVEVLLNAISGARAAGNTRKHWAKHYAKLDRKRRTQ